MEIYSPNTLETAELFIEKYGKDDGRVEFAVELSFNDVVWVNGMSEFNELIDEIVPMDLVLMDLNYKCIGVKDDNLIVQVNALAEASS